MTPTPRAKPRPSTPYDLDTMLPRVLSAAIDSAGCHWCNRATKSPYTGHDGYCPVPALFAMVETYRPYGGIGPLVDMSLFGEELEQFWQEMAAVRYNIERQDAVIGEMWRRPYGVGEDGK